MNGIPTNLGKDTGKILVRKSHLELEGNNNLNWFSGITVMSFRPLIMIPDLCCQPVVWSVLRTVINLMSIVVLSVVVVTFFKTSNWVFGIVHTNTSICSVWKFLHWFLKKMYEITNPVHTALVIPVHARMWEQLQMLKIGKIGKSQHYWNRPRNRKLNFINLCGRMTGVAAIRKQQWECAKWVVMSSFPKALYYYLSKSLFLCPFCKICVLVWVKPESIVMIDFEDTLWLETVIVMIIFTC